MMLLVAVAAVWIAVLVIVAALCVMAKQGDRHLGAATVAPDVAAAPQAPLRTVPLELPTVLALN